MFVKIQHRLKNWILKKSIQKQVRQVVSSIIVSIQSSSKIQRPWKLCGIMLMTVWVIWGTNTPIDRCYKCDFEGDFEPTERGFACPNCGNSDPKTVDVVKRTCGYLGNPQARPMVNGRHKEIAARVKHMNGSTIKIAGHQVTN